MNQEHSINFQETKDKLLKCQEEKQLSSCMQCPQILECKIREEYVHSTYSHLNKGANGEFDF